jgi:hypothetical protein
MSAQPPLELIAARLAEYLGPHTARVAVKTFSSRSGLPGADPSAPAAVDVLLAALRPMLRTLLGGPRAERLLHDLELELR